MGERTSIQKAATQAEVCKRQISETSGALLVANREKYAAELSTLFLMVNVVAARLATIRLEITGE
jgi:23S rRNA-/tRNA-specific pseudouridylate synthase